MAVLNSAFMDGFIEEIENVAKAAGDWLEDLQAWFKVLYDWLIENWETVLKIAMSLLMFVI